MRISKDEAKRVLRDVPPDKAFYFYRRVDNPILFHASSLGDFVSMLKVLEDESLDFHCARGDFENWFRMLGDEELGRRVAEVWGRGLRGPDLKAVLLKVVRARVLQLARSSKSNGAVRRRSGA